MATLLHLAMLQNEYISYRILGALHANIRLGRNLLTVANTLAYYGIKLVTAVKSFIAHAPGRADAHIGNEEKKFGHKTFFAVTYNFSKIASSI